MFDLRESLLVLKQDPRIERINVSVASGEDDGGNIGINATTRVLLEKSSITANAEGGFGGSITINAEAVFHPPDSNIEASSNKTDRDG